MKRTIAPPMTAVTAMIGMDGSFELDGSGGIVGGGEWICVEDVLDVAVEDVDLAEEDMVERKEGVGQRT